MMTSKAIAIAIALVGAASGAGGYAAGQSAVAVATCQAPATPLDQGYSPRYVPMPMTGNKGF